MQILYDGQIYAMQAAGGISRYFSNLIDRLPAEVNPVITTCQKRELNYPQHPNLRTCFYQRFGFRPGRISFWLEKYYFRAISALGNFNLVHPTYYSLLTRQEFNSFKYPVVLTIHDTIHEIFAKQMDPKGIQIEAKRKAISVAKAIICVSQNTKQDLLARYPVPEEKVTVTHLASAINESMADGDEPIPSQPYFLYVGSRDARYKNFARLLSAMAKIVSVRSQIALCVVGSPFDEAENKLIHQLNLQNYIEHYQFCSDLHLAKLYRHSVAFVYPSLYEGFGIPPLEAMSCKTAVVASNRSSIPEVVGDTGILFDPQSTEELADSLLMLLDCPLKRDRLIEKGYQRSKLFSWDKTAAQTFDVYRSVA